MAPARKTRAVAKQPQHSFFKVTKPAALSTKSASTSKRKLEAIESVIPIDVEHRSPQQQSQPISAQSQAPALSRKRRRDTPSTSDSENEATATQVRKSIKKVGPRARFANEYMLMSAEAQSTACHSSSYPQGTAHPRILLELLDEQFSESRWRADTE